MFKEKLYLTSKFLVDDILHLRKRSALRRCILLILSFSLSGLAHLGGEYASGMDMRYSGAMQFFAGQAGGIMVEDAVVFLWQKASGTKEQKRWHVWVGRLWFVLFMFWSMPIWAFPAGRGGDGEVVPWSLVRFVGLGAKD